MKFLHILLLIGAWTILLFSCQNSSQRLIEVKATHVTLQKREKLEKQEEVSARMQHEVLMTRDPALKTVPVERLEVARRQLQSMQVNPSDRNNPLAALVWTERGPNNISGRIRSVLIDPSDPTHNTVYVGSVSGGLWKTTNFLNATPTWTQVLSVSANLAITCLAQDPSNNLIKYAGTGEGYDNFDAVRGLGIYKSIDGGTTWSLLTSTTTGGFNEFDFYFVQDIVVYSNGHVYAAASSIFCNVGGVLKSTNGGASWTRVVGSWGGTGCGDAFDFKGYDLEISVGGDIYASVRDNSVNDTTIGKIFKSVAGPTVGNLGTWTDISPSPAEGTPFLRIELACAPSNNNVVYALCTGPNNQIDSIFRSINGGLSWVNADNLPLWCDRGTATSTDFSRNQGFYDLALAVQPNNDMIVFAGGVDIMKTTNGGTSWLQNTQWASGCAGLPYVHADIHNIFYLPGENDKFIVVSDGGVFYSPDNGITYQDKNTGLRTIQYYSTAMHPTSGSNYLLGGSQDNGSHRFATAGLGTTTTATGGDGGFSFIDQDDPTYQITSYAFANYQISRDGGVNFNVDAFFGDASTQPFINPTDYDNTANIIYSAYDPSEFLRIQNITSGSITANSFSLPSATTNRSVSAVKIDPNVANQVYFAYATAIGAPSQVPLLYRITNAHASPSAFSVPLPALGADEYISSIDIENGDPNHLLITLSNYGISSIYESIDGGANWTSLDNNGVNLPDMPVRWGAFVPSGYNVGLGTNAVGGILLATEMGVMSTSAASGTSTVWSINSTGMGNVRTDMIRIRDSDKMVAVATHGRGMFTGSLFVGAIPVTFISFTGKAESKVNKLNWETVDEQNNKGFELERKYPGESKFSTIGFVKGKNTPNKQSYKFDDLLVDLGKENASYRLKQLDFDGRFKYSSVVTLNRKVSKKFVEYISVNKNNLLIRVSNGNGGQTLNLHIYDASGRLVNKRQLSYQSQLIDIGMLPSGTYVVDLFRSDGERHSQKILKQ